jgi:hypothetical protein
LLGAESLRHSVGFLADEISRIFDMFIHFVGKPARQMAFLATELMNRRWNIPENVQRPFCPFLQVLPGMFSALPVY